MASSPKRIVAGLGNPGEEYAATYHNAGFLAVDHLCAEFSCTPMKESAVKKFASAQTDRYIFVKPLTFMNESGIGIHNALQYFKATADDLVVMHDDSDLPLGEYKLSFERGSAGHKGIESIIRTLGTDRFWRIRIGIRPSFPAGSPRKKAEDFVLKSIPADQQQKLREVFAHISAELARLPSAH